MIPAAATCPETRDAPADFVEVEEVMAGVAVLAVVLPALVPAVLNDMYVRFENEKDEEPTGSPRKSRGRYQK